MNTVDHGKTGLFSFVILFDKTKFSVGSFFCYHEEDFQGRYLHETGTNSDQYELVPV